MTARGSLLDYCGATRRVKPEEGLALDPSRWVWLEKADGAYVRASTDSRGRIASMILRSGSPCSAHEAGDLIGMPIGLPDSVLHGELNAHTEAGVRDRETFGAARVRLFDVSRYQGASIERLGYGERYAMLHRWQAETECYAPSLARAPKDAAGRCHDSFGRFTARRDLTRLPILRLYRGKAGAELAWREVVEVGGGEGLVAADTTAPLGKGKAKIMAELTLDWLVVEVGPRAAWLLWKGNRVAVSCAGKVRPQPGEIWELACDGFYESGVTPRFARLRRRRDDLMPRAAG